MKSSITENVSVYSKILTLRLIYAKEESRQRIFLEKISYTPNQIKAVLDAVGDDCEFRSWIERSIPVMRCKVKTNKIEKAVVSGYNAIENSVVSGYKAIEDSVVNGYKAFENKCVGVLNFF